MKKFIVLLVCFMMMLVLITGCNTTESDTAATTAPAQTEKSTTESTEEETMAPLEVIDVTALMQESSNEFLKADTPNFKRIQEILLENLSINYNIITAIETEIETTVNTLFASGNALPDIVMYYADISNVRSFYEQGLILRLNDAIAEYAPNVKQTFDENPIWYIEHCNRNGDILRLPVNFTFNAQQRVRMLHINVTWLDQLGMDIPETLEEFSQALKAFQENDVNGNGKKDEILMLNFWENASSLNRVIAPAFGIKHMESANDSFYYDDNGNVYHEMVQDSALDYITYLNELYTEGLLDSDYAGQTWDTWSEKTNNNKMAATLDNYWGSMVTNSTLSAAGFDVEFYPLIPLVEEEGDLPQIYRTDGVGYGTWMLTKDCEYPERVIQIADFGYTDEGACIAYYGEFAPGGKYYRSPTAEELAAAGLDSVVDTYMVSTEEGKQREADEGLYTFWDQEGINGDYLPFKMIWGAEELTAYYEASSEPAQFLATTGEYMSKSTNEWAIDSWRCLAPTEEQQAILEEHADLFIYMDEMIDRFITGVEPLENWDAFVEQCDTLGLADVVEVMQDRYDAYLEISQ